MGGTLTLWPGECLGSQYVDLGRQEQVRGATLAFCTLLGPEGPDREPKGERTSLRTSTVTG